MLTATAAVYWTVNLGHRPPGAPGRDPVRRLARDPGRRGGRRVPRRPGLLRRRAAGGRGPGLADLDRRAAVDDPRRVDPPRRAPGADPVGGRRADPRGRAAVADARPACAGGRRTPTSRCSPSPRSAWATSRIRRCPCATGCGASVRPTSPTSSSRPGTSGERRRASGDAAGGSGWSDADRHVNPDGPREVADVAPGTPGHPGVEADDRPAVTGPGWGAIGRGGRRVAAAARAQPSERRARLCELAPCPVHDQPGVRADAEEPVAAGEVRRHLRGVPERASRPPCRGPSRRPPRGPARR